MIEPLPPVNPVVAYRVRRGSRCCWVVMGREGQYVWGEPLETLRKVGRRYVVRYGKWDKAVKHRGFISTLEMRRRLGLS